LKDILIPDEHLTSIWPHQAYYMLQEHALAKSTHPDQGKDLPLLHLQGDALEHLVSIEGLAKPVDLDHSRLRT
jgi:hypothetical protein